MKTGVAGLRKRVERDCHMKRIALLLAAALLATPALAQYAGYPYPSTASDHHGSVAVGGTFQEVFPFNQNRRGCVVQNPANASEDLYVYVGPIGSATTAASVDLQAGMSFNCNQDLVVATDQISVTSATGGHAFVAFSEP